MIRVLVLVLVVAALGAMSSGCSQARQASASGSSRPLLLDTRDVVYVVCEDADEIAIISVKDATRVGSIKVSGAPHAVVYDSGAQRAYVTSGDTGSVSVIDTVSRRVVDEMRIGGQPEEAALSRDGRFLYVGDSSSNVVTVVDASAGKVVSRIEVGEGPESLAFGPDGGRLYVVNLRSNSVSVIDPEANRVIGTIRAGQGPSGVAVSPDGTKLFLGGHGHHGSGKPMTNRNVLVLDAQSGRHLADVETGSMPIALLLAESGKYLYALCHGSNELWAIDLDVDSGIFASLSSARIRVGEDPGALTSAGGGRFIYVANQVSNDVSIVDTFGNRLVATVAVGKRPTGLAVIDEK